MSLIVDLFSGSGGWCQGIRQHLDNPLPVVGLEWDAAACQTRAAAGHLTIRTDVATYPTAPFAGKVTGLTASPPCQSFSRAGKRKGLDDARGQLVWQPLRWAEALMPEWIACEQVPDVLPIWKASAHRLRQLGYRGWAGVLNSADFGVPQTRERAILIARRGGHVGPPEPTHARDAVDGDLFGGSRKPWVAMADALGWGMTERPSVTVVGASMTGGRRGIDGGSGARETMRQAQAAGRWMVSAGITGQGRPQDAGSSPPGTITGKGTAYWIDDPAHWGHTRPATTVQGDPRIGRPGHKHRDKGESQFDHGSIRVTVDEAAVLQSFPRGYPWQGTSQQRYLQVGNAVPPLLAAHVVAAVSGIPWRADVAARGAA